MIRFGVTIVPSGRRWMPWTPVADQRQRQVEESRCLHEAHPFPDKELGEFLLQVRFMGGMNEVEAIGDAAEGTGQAVDGCFHLGERQAGGAEEAEHARVSQLLDHGDRADAFGHGTAEIREAEPKFAAEVRVTHLLRRTGRGISPQRESFSLASTEKCGTPRFRDKRAVSLHHVEREADPSQFLFHALFRKIRKCVGRLPPPEAGLLCRLTGHVTSW